MKALLTSKGWKVTDRRSLWPKVSVEAERFCSAAEDAAKELNMGGT